MSRRSSKLVQKVPNLHGLQVALGARTRTVERKICRGAHLVRGRIKCNALNLGIGWKARGWGGEMEEK